MPRRRLHKSHQKISCKKTWLASLGAICGRDFNAATLINFIVMFVYYLIFITGATYVRSAFSASLGIAGLSSGIMVIGCLAGRFFSGNLVAYAGCKKLLVCGCILYLITLAAIFLLSDITLLFIDRFFTGFSAGIINTVTATVASYAIPQEDHGLGISFFSLSAMLGLALGPFAGFTLLGIFNYKTMILMAICAIAIALLLGLLIRNPHGITHKLRPVFKLDSYIDFRIVPFAAVVLVIFLGYGCLQAFMASFAQERNLSHVAGIFFLVYAAAAIATRPLAGRQMDSYGENRVIYPLFIMIAAAFIIIAYAHSAFIFLFSAALLGIGLGNFQSIGQAVSISMVTPSRYAQATSTFFIFMDFGIGLGSYVFGLIVSYGDYSGMFMSLAVTSFFAAILYAFLHGRHTAHF